MSTAVEDVTVTPERGQLRKTAVQGAGITLLGTGLGLGVQILSTVVLARLLKPSDFGLVTMVTTFSLLLVNFGENGFTEAIIQWPKLDDVLVRNVFWINSAGALLLGAGFAALGPALANFYHNPLVARVVVVIALSIVIGNASVVHIAMLTREMRFKEIALNDVVSRAGSILLAIFLALLGAGYWALVAASLGAAAFRTAGAWYLYRWFPRRPGQAPETPAMIRFALNVYGRFSLNYFARNLDNLLVGWYFNAQALGYYKKAYDLFALSVSQLVTPLSNVAITALSKLDRHSEEYRRCFLNILTVVTFIGMGIGGTLTISGKDVIRLLLGPNWDTAGVIFSAFGPGIGIMFLYYTHGWLHLSIGRADRWLRWGVIEFLLTVILFLVALHRGPVGIAEAWTASFWILTIPALLYAGSAVDLRLAQIVRSLWMFPVASVLAGGATAMIDPRIPMAAPAHRSPLLVVNILLECFVFGALYVGCVAFLSWGHSPLRQTVGLLKDMLPRWRSQRVAREVVS